MWCPKCKRSVGVIVTLEKVEGWLNKEDDCDMYPEMGGQCANQDGPAECSECQYKAPLRDFGEDRRT
jgi:hypothetical protein